MNTGLRKRLDVSEKLRQAFLVDIQELSEAQLAFRPAYNAWSISQVMQHLMQVEVTALDYLRKKNQAPQLPKTGLVSALRSRLLCTVLGLPVKVRAPRGLPQPVHEMTFWEVVKRWNDVREATESFLATLPETRLRSAIFRHPFAGYLNIYQMYDFIDAHLRHHMKQVKRIQAAKDFPKVVYE